MIQFLDMGGYAAYVWPSYGIVIAGIVMNIIWARYIVSVVLLAVACAVVGALVNVKAALVLAILMLLAQSLFSTFHKQRLWRLLDAPVYGEVPSAPGICSPRPASP